MQYKIILFILALAVVIGAQPPDVKHLENFKEIARDGKIMYFANAKDASRNGRFVTMDVMGAHYKEDPPPATTYALNNIAYIVTTWRIDCKERTGQRLMDKGVWKGIPVNVSFKRPRIEKPTKSRNLYIAIEVACKPPPDGAPDSTERTFAWESVEVPRGVDEADASRGNKSPIWIGGNGCNLFTGGAAEQECCTAHDHAYRSGGSLRLKWQADSGLFKCVWKRNKFLAPFVFVGANVGGLFAWHWGKKRELPRLSFQSSQK